MAKIKALIAFFLIMLLVHPVSAYDDSIVSSTSTSSYGPVSANTYYLLKTLTHTIDDDEYLDLYQVDFEVSHSTINTNTIGYKITATPEGGTETTISESTVSVAASTWVPVSRSVSFGEVENIGKDVTVKIYLKAVATSGYTISIRNVYSNGYLVPGVPIEQLEIYVYDESTGLDITPTNVKIYNESISYNADINELLNVSTLEYTNISSGKYIIQVAADGYYSRQSIVDVNIYLTSEINVYLPSEDETVIYDNFKLIDNTLTYDYNEVILQLDKPMPNGTETAFSTYFDYAGTTATYLIATDQYILKIITPDNTINYGWLTPDSDGEVIIVLNQYVFADAFDDWIQYNYAESNESVSFEYETNGISNASMVVLNGSTVVYNTIAYTDSGSFTYVIEGDGIYYVHIIVNTEYGLQFIKNSVIEIGEAQTLEPFPDSYTLALKSILVMFMIVAGVLGLASYRTDLAGMWCGGFYAFAVYQEWCYGNILTVSLIGIVSFAAIVKFHRKDNRSVN
jgi:hypothetical protein